MKNKDIYGHSILRLVDWKALELKVLLEKAALRNYSMGCSVIPVTTGRFSSSSPNLAADPKPYIEIKPYNSVRYITGD